MDLLIYDICTKRNIAITSDGITQAARELGIDYTALYKLNSGGHINNRYILDSDKDKLFVLVDFDTKQEYECISNKSIFVHLGRPYNTNEGKYVDALRRNRQTVATICGRAFHIKGQTKQRRVPKLKAASPEYEKQLHLAFLRRKMASRLRCRIGKVIKCKSLIKTQSSLNLLGCSLPFFIGYMEAQFKDGMTWENYGQWHIDHKIPLASVTNEDDLIKLCNYKNLQPLWAKENISKGDKIDG